MCAQRLAMEAAFGFGPAVRLRSIEPTCNTKMASPRGFEPRLLP